MAATRKAAGARKPASKKAASKRPAARKAAGKSPAADQPAEPTADDQALIVAAHTAAGQPEPDDGKKARKGVAACAAGFPVWDTSNGKCRGCTIAARDCVAKA